MQQTWVLDGHGGASSSRPSEAAAVTSREFLVLRLDPGSQPPPETDAAVWAGLAGEDDRPRCVTIGAGALLVLHSLEQAQDAHPPLVHSVRLWLEKSRVLAVADDSAWEAVGMPQLLAGPRAPKSPADLAARLALRACNRVEPMVDRLDEKLDEIEIAVSSTASGIPRVRLGVIRRSAIVLRRHILPQRDALTTLSIEDHDWIRSGDRARLREAVMWLSRLYTELEAISDRANLVREQIVDRRAEQTNRALLILASVTTIFMPLTLLTGALGMNVTGIPHADKPWAFAAVVVLMLAIAGLLAAWLRSKRWL